MKVYSTYIDDKEVFFKSLIACRQKAKENRSYVTSYEIKKINMDAVVDLLNDYGIFTFHEEIENYEIPNVQNN